MQIFAEFAVLILGLVTVALSDTVDSPAFSRYDTCRQHKNEDDAHMREHLQKLFPDMTVDRPKGYFGTIGIVGGSYNDHTSTYFAAMAALLVGADAVHVFCSRASGPYLQAFSPDILVHPITDMDAKKVIAEVAQMDVILLGPGLGTDNHHVVNILNRVIQTAKTKNIPMVIDVNEYFLTQNILNQLKNYPKPGFIWMMNGKEFEKIYPLVKRAGAFSESQVDIDFKKVADEVLIYRKGCSDTVFSLNPTASWSYSKEGNKRRSSHQGDIIAGATAIYYYWALQRLPANLTEQSGSMFPAALATYSAATLMRTANAAVVGKFGRGALTSGMLDTISYIVYGPASTSSATQP